MLRRRWFIGISSRGLSLVTYEPRRLGECRVVAMKPLEPSGISRTSVGSRSPVLMYSSRGVVVLVQPMREFVSSLLTDRMAIAEATGL